MAYVRIGNTRERLSIFNQSARQPEKGNLRPNWGRWQECGVANHKIGNILAYINISYYLLSSVQHWHIKLSPDDTESGLYTCSL